MNRREFVQELSKETELAEDKCDIVSKILEEDFFLSKDNRKKIKRKISESLNLPDSKSKIIYEESIHIIKEEIKNKLKHPFQSND